MARTTGLFDFQMKVKGKDGDALVEIIKPGIESWKVVQHVRGEWANVCAPGGAFGAMVSGAAPAGVGEAFIGSARGSTPTAVARR